jgi:arsenate reductase
MAKNFIVGRSYGLSPFKRENQIVSVIIFHNPRCSKSRQTLELLEKQGITPTVIEYLKTPPTGNKLEEILTLLGLAPRDLMRRKEALYAECELDNPALSDEDLIGFMIKHPTLIERPIVLANGKAALGRPPEKVLEIL